MERTKRRKLRGIHEACHRDPARCVLVGSLLVSLVCAVALSWPAILNPSTTFTGVSISDSGFVAGKFEALVHARISPFSSEINPQIAWPEGVKNLGALNQVSPLSTVVTWLGTLIVGGVATQYFLGFIGVVLTGLIGARFVHRFGLNVPIAIASAAPLCISASMIHWWSGVPTYTHAWIYIAIFDAGIRHLVSPNVREAKKLSITVLVAVAWSPYVAVFGLIIATVLCILAVTRQRSLQAIKHVLLIALPWLLLLGFYALVRVKARDQVPVRTLEEAADYALSLKALWVSDSAFYVGRVVIAIVILCGICFVVLRSKLDPNSRSAMVVVALAVLAFGVLFIKSSTFPTLWNLIPRVIPQIRQGRYAGQIIQLGLVLIAAIGLSRITSGRKTFVVLGVCLLVLAGREGNRRAAEDLNRWMAPTMHQSQALHVLRNQPDGVTAHFPWDLSAEIGITSDPTPCLAQRLHKKPIINLCDYNIPFTHMLESTHRLSPCKQLDFLKQSGVTYVLVSVAYAQPILRECLGERNTPYFTGKLAEDQFAELWRLSQVPLRP